MWSNTLRLNYLKIFTFFIHVIIQKKGILWKISKRTSAPVFIRLIMMKIKMNMKNRSHRYDRNRPRPRHGHKCSKYKCFIMMILNYISNTWATFEAHFMKKLSNTEAKMRKHKIRLAWPYYLHSTLTLFNGNQTYPLAFFLI